MKKFFKEFKEFITRGNVLQLAIGVVVGGAFGKITTSLVNDIITPLIASLIGASGFSDLKWVIKPANEIAGTTEIAVKYGSFIQTILDFFIIAFCIFAAMKVVMMLSEKLKTISAEVRENLINLTKKEKREMNKIIRRYKKQVKLIEKNKELNAEIKAQQIAELNTARDQELEKFAPKPEEKKPEEPKKLSSTDTLLTEIRDLLKSNKTEE